jgi:hypothetical protein
LTNGENFRDLVIHDEVFQKNMTEHDNQDPNSIGSNEPTQPKLHIMPRGVVNLENLFDLPKKFKKPKNVKNDSSCPSYEVINLGIADNPRNINLGRSFSPGEKKAYLKLFK